MTPHNNAKLGDIAKNVLMPGDPLRAKFIADTFLTDVKQVNSVRNVLAFTGKYKGKDITVMASGMGMPSIGIYSYELFKFYNVDNIVRVGSAGAYVDSLDLYDVVLAKNAWSQSTFAKTQNGCTDDTLYPSEELNNKIIKTAEKLGTKIHVETIHSSDVFYAESNAESFTDISKKHGCVCVEMESFALFHNAKVLGKNAACILTISDSLVSHKQTTAEERQTAFTKMMEIALETFVD